MAAEKLGICVVGAGMMGGNHARAWARVPDARLVAVADVDASRAEALASELGFEDWTTDYRSAVARADVDIVSVCVPAYYHPEVTIFAAERGKHVLCEKPIALTTERAQAMIAAARSNDVRLGIGFQLRYMDATKELVRLIRSGEIGRPVMWTYSFAMPIRPKVAMHDMLRGNGGPVVDFCPHRFDLWSLAFNSVPIQVYSQGMTFAEGRPELSEIEKLAPDTAALIVRYESGDVGALNITWGLPPGVSGQGLAQVWGPKGLIYADLDALRLLTETGKETRFGPYGESPMEEAMRSQALGFAKAVRSGEAPVVTGEDGLAALRVSLAAIRSLESGTIIDPREM